MTGPTLTAGTVPVGPMLSMFDPIYVGIDEFGQPVYIRVIYKNLLAAGEPGGGKSGLLNTLAAHAALSARRRLVLFDGKQVELGMWDDIADEFVGPDLDHAIITLLRLQRVMDNRYDWLTAHRRRKIEPGDGITVITSSSTRSPSSPPCSAPSKNRRVHLPVPRPGSPRPRRRHARHRRHPAAIGGHHPQEPARPVRLPRRVPLHLHRLLRHHPRRRLSAAGYSATDISPVQPRRMPAHRRRRHPRSGSRSPTCPTPTSSPWPTTPPGPAAPGSLPTAGPATAVA